MLNQENDKIKINDFISGHSIKLGFAIKALFYMLIITPIALLLTTTDNDTVILLLFASSILMFFIDMSLVRKNKKILQFLESRITGIELDNFNFIRNQLNERKPSDDCSSFILHDYFTNEVFINNEETVAIKTTVTKITKEGKNPRMFEYIVLVNVILRLHEQRIKLLQKGEAEA